MGRPKTHTSNAERQRAYRERKRNAGAVTEPAPVAATPATAPAAPLDRVTPEGLVAVWHREFCPGVVEQLVRVAELGGHDAALYAASAVRRALDEERAWQALRDWDATSQGYRLKSLVARKDPRVIKFLEEVHLL